MALVPVAQGITSQDHRLGNGEPERMVSDYAARASMRILELESRRAVIRTVGSKPTLSASNRLIVKCLRRVGGWFLGLRRCQNRPEDCFL
jgi:hypothetical protein